MRPMILIGLLAGLAAQEVINGIPVPPSPADPIAHPGLRFWDLPRISHWPAVVYVDERRNCAFHLPVPPRRPQPNPHLVSSTGDAHTGVDTPIAISADPRTRVGWVGGDSGTVGWDGGPQLPVTLPDDPEVDRTSGLLDLPAEMGAHQAWVRIADGAHAMPLRLVDALTEAWPMAALENGFPVDAEGAPVVLRLARPDAALNRRFAALRPPPVRPRGRALVLGDPLAAAGSDAFRDLRPGAGLTIAVAVDDRFPHHAALVALAPTTRAGWGEAPRTVLWSPGNNCLPVFTVSPEEGRVCEALRERYRHQGVLPKLVLLLPPLPAEPTLRAAATARRQALRSIAGFSDWQIIDAQDLIADLPDPNAIAPGITARYPVGIAQARIAAAVAAALQE